MYKKISRKYPLQITISSLFAIITLALGSILTIQNYQQTSEIMLQQAGDAYQRISNELALDIRANYRPVINSIRLLSLSPLISSSQFEERNKHLKLLESTLSSHPTVIFVGVGYQNGDLYGAGLINSEILRNTYQTPENTTLMVMAIDRVEGQPDAALIYLMDETNNYLSPGFICRHEDDTLSTEKLSKLSIDDIRNLLKDSESGDSRVINLTRESSNKLTELLELLNKSALTAIILPLNSRQNDLIGLLCLFYKQVDHLNVLANKKNIDFVQTLSGFAAVTLESRQLIHAQEALLNAFIKLIAGAIDEKLPYTGGHCQRVPEITLMLAKAACKSNDEQYKNFDLTDDQWEELSIAGWLHDCGKVTTPEFVVDKSTKLETIYDRIHEVRMRFEVLKRAG